MQIMTLMTIFDGHLEECEWSVPSWSWLHSGQAAAIARPAVCTSFCIALVFVMHNTFIQIRLNLFK